MSKGMAPQLQKYEVRNCGGAGSPPVALINTLESLIWRAYKSFPSS